MKLDQQNSVCWSRVRFKKSWTDRMCRAVLLISNFTLYRYDLCGRDSPPQSQPRRRSECRWPDGPEPQCQWEPHGALRRGRYTAGQHERQRQHHSAGRDQHHRKPLWQLLQQVIRETWMKATLYSGVRSWVVHVMALV